MLNEIHGVCEFRFIFIVFIIFVFTNRWNFGGQAIMHSIGESVAQPSLKVRKPPGSVATVVAPKEGWHRTV
jgi:hypothetical protein